MTDQTPATEAGRRLSSTEKRFCSAAYDRGRADALREAAERVRALEGIGLTQTSDRDPVTLHGTVSLTDVLDTLESR